MSLNRAPAAVPRDLDLRKLIECYRPCVECVECTSTRTGGAVAAVPSPGSAPGARTFVTAVALADGYDPDDDPWFWDLRQEL